MAMADSIHSILFLIAYMIIIWIVVIFSRIKKPKKISSSWKWTWYAFFFLALGDFFHLVPRTYLWYLYEIAEQTTIYEEPFGMLLYGIGLIATSITVTIFYFCMYMFWRHSYITEKNIPELATYRKKLQTLDFMVILMVLFRLCLIIYPQNNFGGEPEYYFGWLNFRYISNIPFYGIGLIVVYLFIISARKTKDSKEIDPKIRLVSKKTGILYIISFICYSITLFGVRMMPILGMFMIPKTIMYIWALFLCYKYILKP